MDIGPYRLSSIVTGYFSLDGGAMFGTVPKVLWEKSNPADGKNRIRMAMRALLIEGEGKKILVDCGLGDKGGDRFKEMFAVDQESTNIDKALAAKGLKKGDLTDVILTHLHFDHAGGATVQSKEGKWEPSFPNAVYHLQKRNLEIAQKPNPREKASYLKENYEALVDQKRLRLVDGPQKNFFPGIDLWVSYGHTEAQQHVVLSDGKTKLFYGGDIIPMTAHVPLAWIMGYDLHPLTMLEEKEEILSEALKDEWILFYEHDPKIAATRVIMGKNGYVRGDEVSL